MCIHILYTTLKNKVFSYLQNKMFFSKWTIKREKCHVTFKTERIYERPYIINMCFDPES